MPRLSKNLAIRRIGQRLLALIKQPIFIILTIAGNLCIFASSFLFFLAEKDLNPFIKDFLDCVFWSFSFVSGTQSVMPVTSMGKIVGIFTIMFGTLFLWSYMALFISALISPEIQIVEKEIKELEQDIQQFKKQIRRDKEFL